MTSGTGPWDKQTVVCIASGPSLTQTDCQIVEATGLPTVAVNSSWKLARFCKAIYAGDDSWWKQYGHEIDIPAERWTCLENTARRYELHRHGRYRGVTNSGARAIEFIMDEGAAKILLLGFDCSIDGGLHWHGEHIKTRNPDRSAVERWHKHFAGVAAKAKQAGVVIINCTRKTSLTCFKQLPLEEALCHTP